MKLVANRAALPYHHKLPDIIKGYQGMSFNHKVSFWLKALCIVVIAYFLLRGWPPANAQSPLLTQPVVTSEDAVQDVKINDLRTFEVNQENWNRETGQAISVMRDDVSAVKGEIAGVGITLGLLTSLSMFFQLKQKPKGERQ